MSSRGKKKKPSISHSKKPSISHSKFNDIEEIKMLADSIYIRMHFIINLDNFVDPIQQITYNNCFLLLLILKKNNKIDALNQIKSYVSEDYEKSKNSGQHGGIGWLFYAVYCAVGFGTLLFTNNVTDNFNALNNVIFDHGDVVYPVIPPPIANLEEHYQWLKSIPGSDPDALIQPDEDLTKLTEKELKRYIDKKVREAKQKADKEEDKEEYSKAEDLKAKKAEDLKAKNEKALVTLDNIDDLGPLNAKIIDIFYDKQIAAIKDFNNHLIQKHGLELFNNPQLKKIMDHFLIPKYAYPINIYSLSNDFTSILTLIKEHPILKSYLFMALSSIVKNVAGNKKFNFEVYFTKKVSEKLNVAIEQSKNQLIQIHSNLYRDIGNFMETHENILSLAGIDNQVANISKDDKIYTPMVKYISECYEGAKKKIATYVEIAVAYENRDLYLKSLKILFKKKDRYLEQLQNVFNTMSVAIKDIISGIHISKDQHLNEIQIHMRRIIFSYSMVRKGLSILASLTSIAFTGNPAVAAAAAGVVHTVMPGEPENQNFIGNKIPMIAHVPGGSKTKRRRRNMKNMKNSKNRKNKTYKK